MKKQKINALANDIVEFSPIIKKSFIENVMQFKDKGISNHQFFCILILRKSGPLTMSTLADAMNVSKQQLTRIVDELVKSDIVERYTDSTNRRLVFAQLSAIGEARAKVLDENVQNRAAEVLGDLSDADIEKAVESVKCLVGLCKKISTKNPPSKKVVIDD
ncbi:MAG: MarR family transcriptional regulator [Clostridiales bacterium]|jgi:DNA-binding MarR family transcriptional regulator|nr:MarR family transcriptional regulator [Clostridiales bacterium]